MRNVYRIAYLEPVKQKEGAPQYLAPFGWAVHSVLPNPGPGGKLKVVLHQQITLKEASELEAAQ